MAAIPSCETCLMMGTCAGDRGTRAARDGNG